MYKKLVLVLCMLLLSGCKNDQRILEKLGMVQTSSYDLAEDKRLKVTVCVPVIDPDSPVRRELLSTITDSIKESRLVFSRQTDLRVVSGQLRDVLFGMRLAESGLEEYIDTQLRDPSVALSVKVSVVEGDAGELLSKTYKAHSDTGRYITHLLEKEAQGNNIPTSTMYEFSRDFNDDGIDPVTPLIKDAGSKAEVDGIALFQDDRYVMKIPAKDGIIFSIFRDKLRQGELVLKLGEENGKQVAVMFSSISSKRKVKVHHLEGNRFKVDIYVSMTGSVLEYTGSESLSQSGIRNEIEKEISDRISARAKSMVEQMQKHGADALGIGQQVRNSLSYREWTDLDWRETFPKVEVECHTKVTIKDYGKYS